MRVKRKVSWKHGVPAIVAADNYFHRAKEHAMWALLDLPDWHRRWHVLNAKRKLELALHWFRKAKFAEADEPTDSVKDTTP